MPVFYFIIFYSLLAEADEQTLEMLMIWYVMKLIDFTPHDKFQIPKECPKLKMCLVSSHNVFTVNECAA